MGNPGDRFTRDKAQLFVSLSTHYAIISLRTSEMVAFLVSSECMSVLSHWNIPLFEKV